MKAAAARRGEVVASSSADHVADGDASGAHDVFGASSDGAVGLSSGADAAVAAVASAFDAGDDGVAASIVSSVAAPSSACDVNAAAATVAIDDNHSSTCTTLLLLSVTATSVLALIVRIVFFGFVLGCNEHGDVILVRAKQLLMEANIEPSWYCNLR